MSSRPRRTSRPGSAPLELLLVLPILLLIVAAVVEFGQLAAGDQLVADAAARGCRIAARGGDDAAVKDAVRAVLGDTVYAAATVDVRRTDSEPKDGADDRVTVFVRVPARAVTLDILRAIGIDLSDDTLTGRAVMALE